MLKKFITAALFTCTLAVSPLWANEAPAKININTASAETLDKELKYVGEKTANNIVKYRKEHGNFKNVEDMSKVRGVGLQIIKANSTRMTAE